MASLCLAQHHTCDCTLKLGLLGHRKRNKFKGTQKLTATAKWIKSPGEIISLFVHKTLARSLSKPHWSQGVGWKGSISCSGLWISLCLSYDHCYIVTWALPDLITPMVRLVQYFFLWPALDAQTKAQEPGSRNLWDNLCVTLGPGLDEQLVHNILECKFTAH